MKNQEKIQWVQAKMKEFDIAAYIVPTADYHQSEYLGEYFKTRAFFKRLYRLSRDFSCFI
ncbi:hypothetical protein HMPREF9466_00068 [Fusobacterium necrophorum subsp. funduliforme 1_1_36S]|nr:hypothetical protein HMPREF9466_00068 [Fusobacterium necrophorum subsp. funduliforme 1_1_36S]